MKSFIGMLLCLSLVAASALADDPLPSWNEGGTKQAILAFVESVTRDGSDSFVPEPERIAVFDNDGTLWSEQPLYFQALYLFHRIEMLAPDHPEWETREPFASVLKGDVEGALTGGEKALLEMAVATHTGLSSEEFAATVKDWLATARHPETGRPYTEMVYQPMLELLAYLRGAGFKTFIVSGGGIDFMRPWTESVYGIPPEQVVGTSLKAGYEVRGGEPTIVKLAELDFIDDKAGKPVGIHRHIGRRPIFAAGNSDGDFEMIEWTTSGEGRRIGLLVHHDDGEREWAYDRESHVGRLDRGLTEAPRRGWSVVSMRNDWKVIYPEQ
jgi:phosphoglycolate phosphatase-like HAD superfamily hydrolase